MKSEVYKIKVDAREELLACISDADACTEKLEDQLRRPTRYVRTRTADCTEIAVGIFEQLL
jgi:hypothetical protein